MGEKNPLPDISQTGDVQGGGESMHSILVFSAL